MTLKKIIIVNALKTNRMSKSTIVLSDLLLLLKGKPIDEVLAVIESIDSELQVGAEQFKVKYGILGGENRKVGLEENPVKVRDKPWTTRSELALNGRNSRKNDLTLLVHPDNEGIFEGGVEILRDDIGKEDDVRKEDDDVRKGAAGDDFDMTSDSDEASEVSKEDATGIFDMEISLTRAGPKKVAVKIPGKSKKQLRLERRRQRKEKERRLSDDLS